MHARRQRKFKIYIEDNLSVDIRGQLFFCLWPFSCSPKKKAEKEGRRSNAAEAAFPRTAPVVEAGVCAPRTFGAFLGEGAGGICAEKPLPPAPKARGARCVSGRVRIATQVCQRNYLHHHECPRGRMTTACKTSTSRSWLCHITFARYTSNTTVFPSPRVARRFPAS